MGQQELKQYRDLICAYDEWAKSFVPVAGIDALRTLHDLSVDAARLCADETLVLHHPALEE
ncbi:MAG: hypothetical protein H0V70_30125 [Ktedonobacteraceae bacterium]|jgi:hypothetical protein|nr:hypothetical protein [Ktedonobacteraceae bacterium]